MLNWKIEDMRGFLDNAGFKKIHLEEKEHPRKKFISSQLIEQWFSMERKKGLPSYRERLLKYISMEEVNQVKKYFETHLQGRSIPWSSRVLYIQAEK
jgi:hypothetical protein